MTPYAELLEFNQPNPIRKEGFTRIRDQFEGLSNAIGVYSENETDPLDNTFYFDPERIVEFAGAWDYGENNALKLGNRKDNILHRWIDMGHESMLEMADATFFIECSRVVSHELVRHRIASYQQESQRFVKYDFDEGREHYYDTRVGKDTDDYLLQNEYDLAIQSSFRAYESLMAQGVPKQIARYVLPNAMRTRLVMKTNLREWRHICKLRLDKSAQPEMQVLMRQIYDQLVDVFPNVMYNALEGERGVR